MAYDAHTLAGNALAKTGTGTTYTLGAALTNKLSIAAVFTNGASGLFCVTNGTSFEDFVGTVDTVAGTVTRTLLLESSTGSAINWSGTQSIVNGQSGKRSVASLTGPLQMTALGEALALAADAAAARAALALRDTIHYAELTSTLSISDGSGWQSIAGLALTVYVPSTTAKVRLCASINAQSVGVMGTVNTRIHDGSAVVLQGDAAGNRHRSHSSEFSGSATHWNPSHGLIAVITPGVAGNVTYTPQWETVGASAYLNRSSTDTDNVYHTRTVSNFEVQVFP